MSTVEKLPRSISFSAACLAPAALLFGKLLLFDESFRGLLGETPLRSKAGDGNILQARNDK
jgi:hypothetical protein